ncbi:UDP-N-acetylmuramoyl-L-alanyl-D-glutamate--2,6-diaminopimelate ligase [Paraburkholderia bonniea]|uniref:UDP-N-acetylmuramoyl-L-alanyl-D-glutamate--2, 6-diaminopimelate ligase n=1 Tax=Paraburkholderia bonniea TaxID=2152891 RepID=UPI0012924DB4|nr:UDP-N-acetylmuramoyl-L-alanyl-D-glutamate--2,6-diaminopimelate ligase [Paraburkholderia bonniea]WJF90652.1 UDP-N-acetylmuramoyl-L-alanyl-D-glutamate--2,6-diaminopimelate ligase [Paraburkholderia bonniea]WJF93967.1 UDP-N-acetylmuramoyl-L-alanyl-D-glutamate--2,6-diaminopimelate ligase [Paraburkholderia bonniea]
MTALRAAPIAVPLAWLHTHVQPGAHLHADTRGLVAGDVFCAYAVDGADNRQFIARALEQGAAAVLVQPESFAGQIDSAKMLAVPHLNELVGAIASAWYGHPSDAMQVIGVTGTNGKTSCTQWIAAALSALNRPCAIIGTLGSGMPGQLEQTGFTTPVAPQLQRCLAQLQHAGAQAVAMEVSSHALHQGRVNGTAFDTAVFTNLTQDHLDYHGTFAAYEAAKARLFAWPGLRCAVINRDDAAGQRLLAAISGKVQTIAYGLEEQQGIRADALLRASNVRATTTGSAFHLASDWGQAEVEVATLGRFNVSNLLGVLGVLLAAGIPFEAALAELTKLEPVNGRMQRLGGRLPNDEPLIVIDYAHTPDALEKTLTALRPIAAARGGRLVCMFGCGGDRDAGKRPLMGAIADQLADSVIVTSDNPRTEPPQRIIDDIVAGMRNPATTTRIEDRASAILQAVRGAAREDVVVLAGKGHEATQEIMGRKREFSDQDHARLALAARTTQTRGGGE